MIFYQRSIKRRYDKEIDNYIKVYLSIYGFMPVFSETGR